MVHEQHLLLSCCGKGTTLHMACKHACMQNKYRLSVHQALVSACQMQAHATAHAQCPCHQVPVSAQHQHTHLPAYIAHVALVLVMYF